MELYKAFTRCLKELGYFNTFKKNFKRLPRFCDVCDRDCKSFLSFIEYVEKKRNFDIFANILNDAFDWTRTYEGSDFWYRLFTILLTYERRIRKEPLPYCSFEIKINNVIIEIISEYLQTK